MVANKRIRVSFHKYSISLLKYPGCYLADRAETGKGKSWRAEECDQLKKVDTKAPVN